MGGTFRLTIMPRLRHLISSSSCLALLLTLVLADVRLWVVFLAIALILCTSQYIFGSYKENARAGTGVQKSAGVG